MMHSLALKHPSLFVLNNVLNKKMTGLVPRSRRSGT